MFKETSSVVRCVGFCRAGNAAALERTLCWLPERGPAHPPGSPCAAPDGAASLGRVQCLTRVRDSREGNFPSAVATGPVAEAR